MTGKDAIARRDDGTLLDPQAPDEWDAWASAERTRNFCEDDPLLDWLERHGREHGFVPDDESVGYDPRTDLLPLLFERGRLFEERVMRLLPSRLGEDAVVRISQGLSAQTQSQLRLRLSRATARARRRGIRGGDPRVSASR